MMRKSISLSVLVVINALQWSQGCTVTIVSDETDKYKFYAYDGGDSLEWIAADTLTLDSVGDTGTVKCSSDGKDKCKIKIENESQSYYCGDTYSAKCGKKYFFYMETSSSCSFEEVTTSGRLLRGEEPAK